MTTTATCTMKMITTNPDRLETTVSYWLSKQYPFLLTPVWASWFRKLPPWIGWLLGIDRVYLPFLTSFSCLDIWILSNFCAINQFEVFHVLYCSLIVSSYDVIQLNFEMSYITNLWVLLVSYFPMRTMEQKTISWLCKLRIQAKKRDWVTFLVL